MAPKGEATKIQKTKLKAKKLKERRLKDKKATKKPVMEFVLNAEVAVNDGIIVPSDMANYFQNKIQVAGKDSDLMSRVTVVSKKNSLDIKASPPFAKRYIKYLTNKYLSKAGLREYIRVVSNTKSTYDLRYYNIPNDES